MKLSRITVVLVALLASALAASAQTKMPSRRTAAPRPKAATPGALTLKDGIMLKEGKVLVTQMGRTAPLTQEMTLINGTKVSPMGAVVTSEGVSTQLQEGDMMSLSGRIITSTQKAQQDSLLARKEDLKAKGKKKKN